MSEKESERNISPLFGRLQAITSHRAKKALNYLRHTEPTHLPVSACGELLLRRGESPTWASDAVPAPSANVQVSRREASIMSSAVAEPPCVMDDVFRANYPSSVPFHVRVIERSSEPWFKYQFKYQAKYPKMNLGKSASFYMEVRYRVPVPGDFLKCSACSSKHFTSGLAP